ncbi:GNAT family N-acetyltransferase [Rhodococcoides kyotonense]|uniref:FR47-like protein n=1 Tax=Rhodococcoides kyotonense TaxID=398843 RepID=A0A239HWT8_9NOCA|nr:GNAT family N-acetyltransferase [Rhodococcus kyotonensis]SNS85742.1 FR47-like protein [Rhodococcus kyotonensis]
MTVDLQPTPDTTTHPLDDAVRTSLLGEHARFAQWSGRIGRYDPEVAGHLGHPVALEAQDWTDLAALVGPGEQTSVRGFGHEVPAGWETLGGFDSVQLDGSGLDIAYDADAVALGPSDVPEILDLVERTKPGPYRVRTIEMGRYVGIRVDGRLVAMAGERLHPPGWTEISAVCTDPAFRGRGLATRLVRDVGAGIRARGEVPFLHALASNTTAISLYLGIGFTLRKRSHVTSVRTPVVG